MNSKKYDFMNSLFHFIGKKGIKDCLLLIGEWVFFDIFVESGSAKILDFHALDAGVNAPGFDVAFWAAE